MSVYVLWVIVAAGPNEGAVIDAATRGSSHSESRRALVSPASSEPRPLVEIRQELGQLLRDEATTEDRQVWRATVVQLVQLYAEIMCHERLRASRVLNGYRLRLRRRLIRVQKQLERELAREGKSPRVTFKKRVVRRDDAEEPQLNMPSLSDGSDDRNRAGAYGGAPVDDGMALVELIHRTISPEFWDVHGGPGTIFYYRQWHALVIRATPEIHERIGGVVRQLRK